MSILIHHSRTDGNITLEELSKGFDELKFHILQQTSHVVVCFNSRARSLEADALNHIRIQCSLEQPLDLVALALFDSGIKLVRFLFKYVYERVPDDLALLFGSSTSARRERNNSDASTSVRLTPRSLFNR